MTTISERARPKPALCDHCPAKQARSLPQHKRLFGLIRAAHMHWPEAHDFEPSSEEHLRKWLLCKAGHHKVTTIEVPYTESTYKTVLEAAFRAAGAYAFIKISAGRVHIFAPKSIAFDKLSHKEACALFDEIGSVIETELGIKADELLRQTEAAA